MKIIFDIIISTISILQVCMHWSSFLLLVSSSIFFKIKKGRKNKPLSHYQNIKNKMLQQFFFLGFQKLETAGDMHEGAGDCCIC